MKQKLSRRDGVGKHPWITPALLPRDARLASLLWSSSPWAGAPSAGLATEDAHCSSAGRGETSKAHSCEVNACAGHQGCFKVNKSTSSPVSPSEFYQKTSFTRPLKPLPSNPSAKITCCGLLCSSHTRAQRYTHSPPRRSSNIVPIASSRV